MIKRFTIPSLEQVSGNNMLDVLKRYGIVAGVIEYAAKGIEQKGDLLNNTCCDYWTSTNADGSIGKAYLYVDLKLFLNLHGLARMGLD